jgi:thiosulfate dehydrogenase
VRPQDPRFNGDVEQTRKKYHNTPFSMYGQTVNGVMLGDPAVTPPAGAVHAADDLAGAVDEN